MLDLDRMRWELISTVGVIPPRTVGASLHAYPLPNDPCLLLFGGVDEDEEMLGNLLVFHTETSTWNWVRRQRRSHDSLSLDLGVFICHPKFFGVQ